MRAANSVVATRLAAGNREGQRGRGVYADWPRTLSLATITLLSLLLWLMIWWVATRL